MADQLIRGAGQKTAADSLPVVIASDQPAIPVTVTGADVQVDIDASNLATQAGQTDGTAKAQALTVYHAIPATRTENQSLQAEADIKGNLRVAEQAPPAYENAADACVSTHAKPCASAAYNAISYSTIAKANQGVIKASPGNLYKITFVNTNAAQKIVALVNKASAPTTDAPVCYYYVPALSQITVEFVFGMRFTTGIAWAQVTTVAAANITLDTADMLVSGAECS